jgi:hypothetical protein
MFTDVTEYSTYFQHTFCSVSVTFSCRGQEDCSCCFWFSKALPAPNDCLSFTHVLMEECTGSCGTLACYYCPSRCSACHVGLYAALGNTVCQLRVDEEHMKFEIRLFRLKATQSQKDIPKEELRLLGCYAAWLLLEPTFRSNLAPHSSG